MKAAVILFPGSNRERDACRALATVAGCEPIVVWHRAREMPAVDLIVVPGGFSYGDYLRAGAMAANSPVLREVRAQAARGVKVLGICNGFQVLAEAGLLPGALMRNAGLKFICREVHLRVESNDTIFSAGYQAGQVVRFPVAHHDGNYFADGDTLDRLEGEGRIALRYCEADGSLTESGNPNGSARNIAGIYNHDRNVLGLMPHPENAVDPLTGGTDGRALFAHLAEALS